VTGTQQVAHYFTCDVEEWFQVVALAPYAPMSAWERLESRVEASVDALLERMAHHGAKGTFFTVGWVAERHPEMVRRIASAGHALASHTYDHVRITHQTPEAFRDSVRRTKGMLEDLGGSAVIGFRAPSFSIVRGTEWALDVLLEEGYRYDSSLFPVSRAGYGYVGGERDPYSITRAAGRLFEFPPATVQLLGKTLPAAGGAYFRILPPFLVHAALRAAAARGSRDSISVGVGSGRLIAPLLTRSGTGGRAVMSHRRLLGKFRSPRYGGCARVAQVADGDVQCRPRAPLRASIIRIGTRRWRAPPTDRPAARRLRWRYATARRWKY
jgi:polysaccharide deacetylase family protein (PEP-CTERM system associated)